MTLSMFAIAQEDKFVELTTTGKGKSKDMAVYKALRSAIEQAFGVFISSKTEVLNDELLTDQIISVSNGSIHHFEIISEMPIEDNTSYIVTVKSKVSVSKLTSFIESKGIEVEFKGALFAMNIKQQKLNEKNEIKAVTEIVGSVSEKLKKSFDYSIKCDEPRCTKADNNIWDIPITITATCNKNLDFCANYLIQNLSALSLSLQEVESFVLSNRRVFLCKISYSGKVSPFYLRSEESIKIIDLELGNWEKYIRLYTVKSGLDVTTGKGDGKLFVFKDADCYLFPTPGKEVALFRYNDKRTLDQIQQISGYSVSPVEMVNIKN